MNEADSERIGESFIRRGFELTDSVKAADAVVVNTCTVRQRAEDKAISQIGRLRKWKLARPGGKLFVVGCAAEKLGGKYIKNRFPFVDEVIGGDAVMRYRPEPCRTKTEDLHAPLVQQADKPGWCYLSAHNLKIHDVRPNTCNVNRQAVSFRNPLGQSLRIFMVLRETVQHVL